jgi:hypothetical protein
MNSLWIEAGEMSGGSRNQIEFDEDLAAFFDIPLPPVGGSVEVLIDVGSRKWHQCSLAAKKTTFGVVIYRLNLPTAAKGGHEYPGTVIKFARAGGRYFKVEVVVEGSPELETWRAISARNETLARTGGAEGREFGLIDDE